MKNQIKKTCVEGTCIREVVGGLSSAVGNPSTLFLFKGGLNMNILKLRLKELEEKGRPPIALMSRAGEVFQKPSNNDIAAEIGFVIVPQIRACYDLISCEQEGGSVNLSSVADLLFVTCERLMCLLGYINNSNIAEVNPAKAATQGQF